MRIPDSHTLRGWEWEFVLEKREKGGKKVGNENVMSLAYNILKRDRLREKGGNGRREFSPSNSHSKTSGFNSSDAELIEEYKRNGRIRIEGLWEGGAWLVESYDKADDIREGAVYSRDMWPHFVKLDPEHKLQIHEFLCQLGGGHFDGVKTIEQPGGEDQ